MKAQLVKNLRLSLFSIGDLIEFPCFMLTASPPPVHVHGSLSPALSGSVRGWLPAHLSSSTLSSGEGACLSVQAKGPGGLTNAPVSAACLTPPSATPMTLIPQALLGRGACLPAQGRLPCRKGRIPPPFWSVSPYHYVCISLSEPWWCLPCAVVISSPFLFPSGLLASPT